MSLKECEYCGEEFDTENCEQDDDDEGYYESDEYCSLRCEEADEAFLKAEEAADRKFVEMAYGTDL